MIIGISGKKQHGKDTIARMIQYLVYYRTHKDTTFQTFLDNFDNVVHSFAISYDQISGWNIKRFSDKVKDIVCLLIGCSRYKLEDDAFKNKELSEEWRVWYGFHYKSKNNNNPRGIVTELFATKYEAQVALNKYLNFIGKTSPTNGYGIDSYLPTPRLMLQLVGTDCGRNIIHPNIWVNSLMADYVCPNCGWTENQDWIIPDVRFPNEVNAIIDRYGLIIRVVNPRIESNDTHLSETALDKWNFVNVIINDGSISDLLSKVDKVLLEHKIVE